MKIRLLMLVERDAEGRLTGVIFQEGQFRPECISGRPELLKIVEEVLPMERLHLDRGTLVGLPGTLALLKIMEDVVPPQGPLQVGLEPVGRGAGPGLAPWPAGG